MSQLLLSQLLAEKVPLDQILRWISLTEAKHKHEFSCSRGEFTSHLLNFIHDEALCFEKYRETPKKVQTPKSIRKLEISTKPRRRPALFNQNESKNDCRVEEKKQIHPLSPVSPLYTRLNTQSVENSPGGATPKSKNFCLGDFISPNRKSTTITPTGRDKKPTTPSGGDSKRTRRINPTNVAQRKSLNTENSFDFKNDNTPNVKQVKETKTIVPKAPQKEIPPDLTRTTAKIQLNILITLYVELIDSNQVLNVTSELYFIITLLLCKQFDADYFPSPIFASIHNVVYFALNCLRKIADFTDNKLLNLLDKSTLRLLTSNERVKSLDASLMEKIVNLSEDLKESPRKSMEIDDMFEKHVCFDFETDNRENFPSDASFHAFRKQRDMFYEILNAWETNHTADGWNFAAGLGGKVRSLMGMHSDPANFRHLSRLVKAQLLITCTKIQSESLPENHLSFLTTLPNVNAEKLNRLKTRLVAKDQSPGINAPPTFPGHQEFYKELIIQAQTHVFCTHLRNVLIQDLLQLNDTTFETDAGMFDQSTRSNYCLVVKSLQLLAKFISLIESMPYTSCTMIVNDKITLEEVESRSWMAPPIDLYQKLTTAMDNGHLVLLIPWLVEYLAMLDGTSLRLPYFERIFEKLFEIFLNCPHYYNYQLIRCCLGWLFEQNHFPSENYFHFLNFKHRVIKWRGGMSKDCVDSVRMVDLDMMYRICPFLKEFKKLLQYNCNRNGSITSKHITPVTAIETISSEMSERRMKLQLQEAFLNSRPSSLRKTLEFVSERIASCIVKTICNNIVPDVKARVTHERKKLFVKYAQVDTTDGVVKMEIKQKLTLIIENHLDELKNDCENTLTTQIDTKIHPAVLSLVCSDELQETVDVCTQITSRLCEERVRQWINTRIITSVFKEFDMDIERIDKFLTKEREESSKQKFITLPTQGRSNIQHIDSDDEGESSECAINPSKLLTQLQRTNSKLLHEKITGNCKLTVKNAQDLLQNARKCHQQRSDLSDIAWHQINQLIVDYFILLCKTCPEVTSTPLLDEFISFWSDCNEIYLKDIFIGIISIRNIVILMHAPQNAWKTYSNLLSRLLKHNILSLDDFETQCLAVFRTNWESDTLGRICECFQVVVDQHDGKDQFTFLLGFLADYCSDLDF